ncbi:MAG: CBO0543 family protein [Bacillota bacterium]|nr:CBO0543 family protein [Bacillota bacterium]
MNTFIVILGWSITVILLILFTPRSKIRHAIVIFFFKQFLTWILGLTVAEFGLIEYPVRSFANATKSSFDFEYFIYPAFCVIFNLHYPESKDVSKQFMYYFSYCSVLTLIEAVVEKYTDVITYIHWAWYITWITFFITFYASRKFYLWFYKLDGSSNKS